jgi:hypothetical protein
MKTTTLSLCLLVSPIISSYAAAPTNQNFHTPGIELTRVTYIPRPPAQQPLQPIIDLSELEKYALWNTTYRDTDGLTLLDHHRAHQKEKTADSLKKFNDAVEIHRKLATRELKKKEAGGKAQ